MRRKMTSAKGLFAWYGNAETQDDCKAKCVSNEECNYYSFWHTGYCQIDRVCNHWGSDGSRMISTYKRRRRTKRLSVMWRPYSVFCKRCKQLLRLLACVVASMRLMSLQKRAPPLCIAYSHNLPNPCNHSPQHQAVYDHGLLRAWIVASSVWHVHMHPPAPIPTHPHPPESPLPLYVRPHTHVYFGKFPLP